MIRALALLAGVSGAVVALDRWTKHWAVASLPYNQPIEVIGEFVRLTYTRNSGVAFGLGAGSGFPFYVFSMLAAAVILWLFATGRAEGLPRQLALALVFGGAVGNLVDRVTTGTVVDFIEVGFSRWYWPVFNVADSAVTVGVVLFALTWSHRDETRASQTPAPSHDPDPRAGGAPQRGAAGSLPGGGADRPLP